MVVVRKNSIQQFYSLANVKAFPMPGRGELFESHRDTMMWEGNLTTIASHRESALPPASVWITNGLVLRFARRKCDAPQLGSIPDSAIRVTDARPDRAVY